jgi:hypothetical protein
MHHLILKNPIWTRIMIRTLMHLQHSAIWMMTTIPRAREYPSRNDAPYPIHSIRTDAELPESEAVESPVANARCWDTCEWVIVAPAWPSARAGATDPRTLSTVRGGDASPRAWDAEPARRWIFRRWRRIPARVGRRVYKLDNRSQSATGSGCSRHWTGKRQSCHESICSKWNRARQYG